MNRFIHSLVRPIALRSTARLVVKVALDATLVGFALLAAYVTRFEELPRGTYGVQMLVLAAVLPWVRVAAFRSFGVYAQSWRLFGLHDAIASASATAAVSVALLAARIAMPYVTYRHVFAMPIGVIALEGLFTLTTTTVIRVLARLFDEHRMRAFVRRSADGTNHRALLVGAGRAGQAAARELRLRPDLGYDVVGFLDDDPVRQRQVIEGVRVLGPTAQAAEIAARVHASMLVLTMPATTRAELRAVALRCHRAGLPVRTIPGMGEPLGDALGITKIRPLRIEDLLGREVVDMGESAWTRVQSAFTGRRIVVTGAGGSIGSELCRQLAALEPAELVLLENNENNLFEIESEVRKRLGSRCTAALVDIRDYKTADRLFTHVRPEVVFHAAAFKHVPMMEHHPSAAIDNNVLGTKTMVELAHLHGVERFLVISTDKAVHPTSVMGASKRVAEMVALAKSAGSRTKFSCVRFGNVLGSRGSVLHTFRRQIETGGPVTVTHPEMTRFFMTIPEAVRLVIQAAAVGQGGEVFLLDMGEPVKIVDLARHMIELAGFSSEEIPISFVGLRPGEKLYEELLLEDEGGALPSELSGIFLARLAPVDPSQLEQWIARLEAAARASDAATIRRLLAVVAGYRPNPDAPAVSEPEGEPDEVAAVG